MSSFFSSDSSDCPAKQTISCSRTSKALTHSLALCRTAVCGSGNKSWPSKYGEWLSLLPVVNMSPSRVTSRIKSIEQRFLVGGLHVCTFDYPTDASVFHRGLFAAEHGSCALLGQKHRPRGFLTGKATHRAAGTAHECVNPAEGESLRYGHGHQ